MLAAFPGASGPAMNVTGGRGGDVYHVTNLTDHATNPQPGSLRYGINTAPSGGRTIVFDVGGTIKLATGRQGWLETGKSNLTIAGQTAPSPGITIMGNVTEFNGNNVIIRHLKFRPKLNGTTPDSLTKDALWLTGTNIIVDHVSASWYDDEGISASDGASNITVQYALLGNGLNYNGHGYGAIIGSDVANSQIAYHHNLFAHHKSRLPRLGNETSAVTYAEFSNNVVYNWQSSEAGYSGTRDSNDQEIPGGQHARANFVGNTYIVGNSNGPRIFESGGYNTHIYHSGNKLDTDKDGVLNDGRDVVWSDFIGDETQVGSRFNVPNITYESASTALNNTLDYAGAFWWARDAVDTRLVNETRNGTGNIIATANSTEWNNLWNASQVNRPSGWDTDGDGMPNAWETANGFNPNSADHNGDADGDGYRNIEEYLDYAAQGSPALDTTPPTSSVASLPATTTTTSFTVSWSGSDTGGSGLKNYDVYVSTNGGSYTLWQNATTSTSAVYTGVDGSQYRFYSRARDNANNLEAAPSSPDATTTIQLPTSPTMVGWWKLDESSGSTVADSSGNGHNGTANGAGVVAGLLGNARNFDGTDDYVSLPTSIVNSSAGSIAMWVKTGTNFSNLAHLFSTSSVSDGDGLGSHAEMHLNFTADEKIQFFIEGGSSDVNITSSSSYANNTWHHVAATWDINGNAVLYVNGTQVGSVTHDGLAFVGSAITYLGRPGAATRYYTGQMDDVRIYNYALSAGDVATLATPGPSPIAWWQMNESSGSTITDSSGNGHHGTLNGPTRVTGIAGNGLSFDGTNDYVSLPTSIVNSSVGSVAMWVKTGTNFSNLGHLFNTSSVSNGDGGGSHAEMHLNFTADEKIQFFIEGGSSDVSITSSSTYADNSWHHVAATWDINGNAVLYVDGSQVGSVAHNATAFTGSAITYLGRPGAATRYYSGQMDDVRLFSSALTAGDVAALAGGGGSFAAGGGGSLMAAPSGTSGLTRTNLFSKTRIADSDQDLEDLLLL